MNQAIRAVSAPAAAEPSRRPIRLRNSPPNTIAGMMRNGLNRSDGSNDCGSCQCGGSGSGSFSPSAIRTILSTPAATPPPKSPALNFGVMSSSMMRLVVASVSAPLEAVTDLDAQAAIVLGDDEQRAVVDLLAADLPGLRDRAANTARWPRRPVVGTISTAIWLPFRVSRSFSICVSEAMSPAAERAGLIDHAVRSAAAPRQAPAPNKPSTAAAQEWRLLQRSSQVVCSPRYFAGAGVGLKSTFGAVEIDFSFSTVKFGFSL